jgi:bifunctional ADP-heptose synthase (sugar kinase/adenylyltransferase)
VAALEAVDYVTIFDEPDPLSVLSRVRPEIHCKGAEYASGNRPVPERDLVLGYGGEIRFLPLYQGRSTTGLIERIRAAAAGDACRK